MGLYSTLNIGTSTLAASQLSMDVAGQNIANANVDGYSRKELTLSPEYAADATYGQMGYGVDVVNIKRQRDQFVDQQIEGENQELGADSATNDALTGIENLFTEPSSTGLQNAMDQFFNSWQNLANNPADSAARTAVLSGANDLTDVFHTMSGQLNDMKTNLNTKISATADQVNSLAKDIYNLNQEIASVQITGQNANDSLDKRDQDLKQLSQLVDIQVTQNALGQDSVATDGSLLVSPTNYAQLETATTTTVQADGSTVQNIGLRWSNSKRPYVPQSGSLKGLFDARDTTIPEYQGYLDTLANGIVSQVNAIHTKGFSLNGYTGFDFFDPNSTGASDIKLSNEVASNIQNIATAGGQGAQPGTTAFAAGAVVFGNPPVNLANKNLDQGSVQVTSGGTVLRENVDYHIDYVNGTIQTLNNLYDGAALTVNYNFDSGTFAGPGDNSVALQIAQLQQNETMNVNAAGQATATFGEYYSAFVGKLGQDSNTAQASVDTRTALIQQYQTQQDSVAGVSLDEEMANMVQAQHTYEAGARLITTVNSMLDALMAIST